MNIRIKNPNTKQMIATNNADGTAMIASRIIPIIANISMFLPSLIKSRFYCYFVVLEWLNRAISSTLVE